MNIRNIALVAGLAAISGVANAQSWEFRGGVGVLDVNHDTRLIRVANVNIPFTVQIWVNFPAPRNHTSMNVAMGYAWSNATANNSTQANDVNNRLGTLTYANMQTIIPALPVGFRRALAVPAGNFTVPSPYTGVQAVNAGHTSGGTPAPTFPAGSIHIANVTFTGNTLALNEIYGDDADEFGLQMLTNGSTTAPSGASYSGFGGWFNAHLNPNPAPPLPLGGPRYQVQAVPEPATMAALGLGLAALARRRRNKK